MNSVVRQGPFWSYLGFRARLVIGLSGLFAIILMVGYWAIFLEFQGELEKEFDRSLHNYAKDLLRNVSFAKTGEARLPFEVIFSEDKVFPFPHGDALVKIYKKPHQELFTFSTDPDAPTDLSLIKDQLLQRQSLQFLNLNSHAGLPWRGVLMFVEKAPVPGLYFLVTVPRAALTEQVYKFRSIFIAGQVLIFLISAFMISVLARGLLRPLETLTAGIHELSPEEDDFLFTVPEGPPEINLLANVLNKLLNRIKQSLVAHQDFVAHAAHQLKTPLTVAKGHLETLVNKINPIDREALETALSEIDFMSKTINNLLHLVEIESGFQRVKNEEVHFLELTLLEMDRVEYSAKKRGLKFQVRCEETDSNADPLILSTDPYLVSIVLNTLFSNAIKFASESPIEVKVSSTPQAHVLTLQNKTLLHEQKHKINQLKEKFVRGPTPTSGQGLGLYIAFKIASLLNTQLTLEQDDQTFKVIMEFPIARKQHG